MATPSEVTLTIAATSGFLESRVIVEYRAEFTQDEINGNVGSLEVVQLFGEDPPAGPAGDDLLFTFFPIRIIRPDGQTARQISRSAVVPNVVLDEDPGILEDEIYARVRLGLNSARSGIVST